MIRLAKNILLYAGFAAVLLLAGCQSKSVTIVTDPVGATIVLKRIEKGVGSDVPLSEATTPLTRTLDFPPGVSYQVLASKPQFHDKDVTIEFEPKSQKVYQLQLERYITDVVTLSLEPRFVAERNSLILVPEVKRTEGYLDSKELSPNARICEQLANSKEYPDFSALAISPTEDTLLFQVVREVKPEVILKLTKNESLLEFAQRNSVTPEQLRRLNGPLEEKLSKGQVIKIADAQLASDVIKQRATGQSFSPVTTDKALNLHPTFTFTGDSIVFSSDRIKPNQVLWRVKSSGAAGGALTRVTSTDSQDYNPSAGPDGRIAFMALRPSAERPEIWTVMPNGGELTQLPDGESPQISPDGRKILFLRRTSADQHVRQMWIMNNDGGGQAQLTQNQDYDIMQPRWSPDGNWIAFASNEGLDSRGLRNFDIWVMSTDGKQKIQVTTNGSWDDSPCWDRTGKLIYFRSNRGGEWHIWRVEPVLP